MNFAKFKKRKFVFFLSFIAPLTLGCATAPSIKSTGNARPDKNIQVINYKQSNSQNSNSVPVNKTSVLYKSANPYSEILVQIPKLSMVKIYYFQGLYFLVEYQDRMGFLDKRDVILNKKAQEIVDDYWQRKDEEEAINREREFQHVQIEEMRKSLESNNAWIKVFRADIRQSDSSSSNIKDQLWRGSEVYILDAKGDWLNILYDPPDISKFYEYIENIAFAYKDGWVHKDALSTNFEGIATKLEKSRWHYVKDNSVMPEKFKNAIIEGKVSLGMSTEMVTASWSKPKVINRTADSRGVFEHWAYESGVHLYFENDKLSSWKD